MCEESGIKKERLHSFDGVSHGCDVYIIVQAKAQPVRLLVWVETVQGLEKGKKRLFEYKSKSTDDYYLFDVRQARVLDVLAKAKSF